MSDALSIAANGLNASAARIAKTTSNIVNASSTGSTGDLASNLIAIQQDKTNYEAEAKVASVVEKNNKALLDILA